MKNRFENLRVRDVPEVLDRRIMAAAAHRAKMTRFRRSLVHCVFTATASAAALLIAGTVFLFPEAHHGDPAIPTKSVDSQLLELADWSALEQESYNLSFELYSGRQALAELSSVKIPEGY
ncbi:hypothetical protein [uncultured Victivallis sp.]|uniref:hypothetical protein n=1 Tax=uncultured Victivallis sp. TaxID=354118 RepID=UPI0025E11CAB|nr:hypothetical protein [uncultured Victivallis sp.]